MNQFRRRLPPHPAFQFGRHERFDAAAAEAEEIVERYEDRPMPASDFKHLERLIDQLEEQKGRSR